MLQPQTYVRFNLLLRDRHDYEPERNPDGTPLPDENGVPLTWEDGYPDDATELRELELVVCSMTPKPIAE